MRKGGNFAYHAMYDYIRLELTGYIPPAPASVNAYAGNGRVLLAWPVQPGATSYNILRSTTSGSNFASITNGVTGPVCGSGFNNATYLDTNVVNNTTYYYIVQSANSVGSTNSPQSSGVTPSGAISSAIPAAPASVSIGGVAHHSATVNWGASSGANFYTVYRSTLFDNGGGASNVLGTIVLNNTNTTTSFTDTAVTDGTIYRYWVTATSAAGTSTNSVPAVAVPLPAPPASAPGSLGGRFYRGECGSELVGGSRSRGLHHSPGNEQRRAIHLCSKHHGDDFYRFRFECGDDLLLSGVGGQRRGRFSQFHGHRRSAAARAHQPLRFSRQCPGGLELDRRPGRDRLLSLQRNGKWQRNECRPGQLFRHELHQYRPRQRHRLLLCRFFHQQHG